ncbi:MAG: 1-acyl-sn-glycerol-3-phosphate acyltransferase [Gammaproteobacteria bacterium]|nr:1-acyl-sn-glycerol-3-phosphate acyltransferase [Gammaproteobacteria bacterium]
MLYIRSVLYTVVMIATVPLFVIPGMLLFPFPYKIRYGFFSRWAYLVIWLLKVICNLRHEVQGKENIPTGPAIIFCKHQSLWESIALQTVFPPHLWILKKELMKLPFFGWALYMLESIAIDRKGGRKAVDQIVKQGIQRLDQGRWVVVFPEGTRIAPGERKKFGIGGAILAEKSGYPVVPVAHNAGEFWRRRALIKRPGVIKIVIGEPIETNGRTAVDIKTIAEQWINKTVDDISRIKYTEIRASNTVKAKT